jgi:nitrogen fixation protein FixH
MKLNFGHKIAIVYVSFMLFMLSLLYFSLQMDHELVTDQYYVKEMAFQGKKDAWHNLQDAGFKVNLRMADQMVIVEFVDLPEGAVPVGEVALYKPDKASLDETHTLNLSGNNSMHITPRGQYGRYKVSVRFQLDGKDYYAEKELLL